MPIDPTQSTPRTPPGTLRETRNQPAQKPDAKTGGAPPASAHFHASKAADSSQDVDASRVAEIRSAISNGELKIDSSRIADAIIESARELTDSSQT